MTLPVSLHCLTIQHIIDDANAVEGYLRQYPEVEKCFPVVVRDVFKLSKIPDPTILLIYLQGLWGDEDLGDKLARAAEFGLVPLMQYYVENNDADVHSGGLEHADAEDYPLIIAASNGQLDAVKFLVEHGANVQAEDSMSLALAARNGYPDIVAYLIKHGADVNDLVCDPDQDDEESVLAHSIRGGHIGTVRQLIEAKAHVYRDDVLRNAINTRHADIIRLLLSYGVIFGPDNLNQAVEDDSPEIVEIIAPHFNVDDLNNELLFASRLGLNDIVEILLENKANIHYADDAALSNAIRTGKNETVKLLIEENANVNVASRALRMAAWSGHLDANMIAFYFP